MENSIKIGFVMFKKKLFFFYFILLFSFQLEAKPSSNLEKKTICLNMIVKNESRVIQRCLASVKKMIDYWVIIDTGSTDGTQKIITEFMKDVPGELHERPWVNFEHNRNEVLDCSKNKGDYLLFIDADEFLAFSDTYIPPRLDKDFYPCTVCQTGGIEYQRILLINNHINWRWEGVLHEQITSPFAKTYEVLTGIFNISNTTEGNRSQDPRKYHKDAEVLEQALLKEPDNSRYVFYLAQSYANAGEFALSLKNYEKRAAMGGWDQEVFWSMYCVGRLQALLQMSPEVIINSFCKAYQFRPSRAEPLYQLADYYNRTENYSLGYMVSKFALSIPNPHDGIFLEHWVYEYGILLQLANSAYFMGKYEEALDISKNILKNEKVSLDVKKSVEGNIAHLKSILSSRQPN